MKKYILLSVMSCASLFANSEDNYMESQYPTDSTASKKKAVEKVDTARNFNKRLIPYVKLGPDVINMDFRNASTTTIVSPNIGFGIRSESYTGAVDVSVSYAASKLGKEMIAYQMIFPKIVYHRFLSPQSANSFYYGGGASWAEIRNHIHGVKFSGLMGNLSVGYEMGRDSSIRQMIQLDLDQPLLAYRVGESLPLPSVQASYSLGF